MCRYLVGFGEVTWGKKINVKNVKKVQIATEVLADE